MTNFFIIILEQACIYMPLLFGAYISMTLMKAPDLSIETAYLFGAMCAMYPLNYLQGYPLMIVLGGAVLASMLGGALVGVTSSCITRIGKIPHLLSSIITFGLYHGLFQLLSRPYTSLASYPNPLARLSYIPKHPEFITIAIICFVLLIGLAYFLQTQLGYSLMIFGRNSRFFSHFDINANYVFIAGIIVANALAGISGYLLAQTNNLVEINMGLGKALFCVTALILGKAIVTIQSINFLIPPCGALLYFLLQQLLLTCGFNLTYFTTIQALVVLVILLVVYPRHNTQIDIMRI